VGKWRAGAQKRQIPHVPLGLGGWPLGYEEQRRRANCRCN